MRVLAGLTRNYWFLRQNGSPLAPISAVGISLFEVLRRAVTSRLKASPGRRLLTRCGVGGMTPFDVFVPVRIWLSVYESIAKPKPTLSSRGESDERSNNEGAKICNPPGPSCSRSESWTGGLKKSFPSPKTYARSNPPSNLYQRLQPPYRQFLDELGRRIKSSKRAWQTAVLKAHGHTPVWVWKKNRQGSGGSGRLDRQSQVAYRTIDLHFHDLRDEAGSRLLEAGWPHAHACDIKRSRHRGSSRRFREFLASSCKQPCLRPTDILQGLAQF
jgi:hypothetical protein